MHMLTVMIVGLAMGTTLSQAVSVAVSLLVIVKRNTGISLTKADLRPDRAVMGRLLKIGIPIALQDGFIQISFMVITIIANRRGLTDAAAVGIVEKMIGFLFLVPSSMLSTVSALGAQNIGAGKPERAKATLGCAIAITLGFISLIVILVEFLAEPMVGLFTPDDTVVLSGGQYLGLLLRRGPVQLQWLLLRHRPVGPVLPPQHPVHSSGPYSRRLPDLPLLPGDLAAHEPANAAGSLFSILVCLIAYGALLHGERRGHGALSDR